MYIKKTKAYNDLLSGVYKYIYAGDRGGMQ